jgi:hypothetical protein
MLKRAGHRLLVSPWFAAGAGVVIATGVMIYTPHTNFAIDIQKCQLVSCTKLTPQGAAPLQAGPGSPVTPSPSTHSLPKGMTFSYQVLGQSTRYGFSMLITIHSPDSFGQWQLSFSIPGATGIYVYWPRWKSTGSGGITVSSYYAGTESVGFAMISAHENGSAGGSSQNGYTVQFQLRGTGTPSRPNPCNYNGASCTFKPSTSLAPANSPGTG